MPDRCPLHEDAFRSALEAHDYSRAEEALREYVAWFRSGSRSLPDIESAMNLFAWGIAVAASRRVRIAEELMRLKRLFETYKLGSKTETWHIVG